MTEKETVTAREDQPRPTPPDRLKLIVKCANAVLLKINERRHEVPSWVASELAVLRDMIEKADSAEAQGEAPQVSDLLGKYLNTMVSDLRIDGKGQYLRDLFSKYEAELVQTGAHPSQDAPPEKQHVCPLCGLGHIIGPARGDAFTRLQAENYTLAIQLKHYMSRCGCPADNPCWLCTDTGELISLEKSGARSTPSLPAQDASPVHGPFMEQAADYLREWSNRYKQHGHYARMEEWSGGQAQYHLANFAGRMASGSTPSPDPPQKCTCSEKDAAVCRSMPQHQPEYCRVKAD